MIQEPLVIRISSDDHCRLSDLFKVGSIWVGGKEFSFTEFNIGAHEAVAFAQEVVKAEGPWSGEGLPPVGTVCEFAGGTTCPEDPFDKDLKEGMQVTIIAHFKSGDFTLAAFTFDPENPDRGMVQVEQGNFGCFRPIRTPEQIAADKRLHEIRNALTAINSKVHFPNDLVRGNILAAAVEAMIDAGYRKQGE